MLTIKVYSFGKLRLPGSELLESHYLKLLNPYARFSLIELKESKISPPKLSTLDQLKQMVDRDPIQPLYALDERGPSWTSHEWAESLKEASQRGGKIGFAVGPASGWNLDPMPSSRPPEPIRQWLSLGPQTMAHDLTRIVLLEQIYRALTLNRGHPYHK